MRTEISKFLPVIISNDMVCHTLDQSTLAPSGANRKPPSQIRKVKTETGTLNWQFETMVEC